MSYAPTSQHVAYHEAGHAVAAFLSHRAFSVVTIEPIGRKVFGHVMLVNDPAFQPGPRLRRQLAREAWIGMAGPAAASVAKDRGELAGTTRLLANRALNAEVRLLGVQVPLRGLFPTRRAAVDFMCEQCNRAAEVFRSDPRAWQAVKHLATALLAEKRIGRRRARQIISDAIHRTFRRSPGQGATPGGGARGAHITPARRRRDFIQYGRMINGPTATIGS